jgi:hypothetical protein
MRKIKVTSSEVIWRGRGSEVAQARDLICKKLDQDQFDSANTFEVQACLIFKQHSKPLPESEPFYLDFSEDVFRNLVQDANRYRWVRKTLFAVKWGCLARIQWNWARMLMGEDCDQKIDELIKADKKNKRRAYASF